MSPESGSMVTRFFYLGPWSSEGAGELSKVVIIMRIFRSGPEHAQA